VVIGTYDTVIPLSVKVIRSCLDIGLAPPELTLPHKSEDVCVGCQGSNVIIVAKGANSDDNVVKFALEEFTILFQSEGASRRR
jgi:hypothetical protein